MSDVLAAAFFPDTLSDAERAQVQRLIETDPAARRAYRRAQALQARLAGRVDAAVPDRTLLVCAALRQAGRGSVLTPEEQARLEAAQPDLDRAAHALPALADVMARVARDAEAFDECWTVPVQTRLSRPPRPRAAPRRVVWRAGMALAVATFAAVALLLVQRDAAYTTIEVAAGKVEYVTLADGSRVKLMGGSSLTFSDPEKEAVFNRQVRLSGSAFFDVTPGTQRFVVRTEQADVTVLGTRFGVRAEAAATEVTLVEGALLLAPSDAPLRGVTLAPGQQSRMAQGAQVPSPPETVEPATALAWTGLLFFRDTPLGQAAAQLSQALGLAVEVAPALAPEAVTGTFDRAQGAEEIVRALAATLDAQAVQTARGWRIE